MRRSPSSLASSTLYSPWIAFGFFSLNSQVSHHIVLYVSTCFSFVAALRICYSVFRSAVFSIGLGRIPRYLQCPVWCIRSLDILRRSALSHTLSLGTPPYPSVVMVGHFNVIADDGSTKVEQLSELPYSMALSGGTTPMFRNCSLAGWSLTLIKSTLLANVDR